MADEFGFHTLNAKLQPADIQTQLRDIVSEFFARRNILGWPADAVSGLDGDSSSDVRALPRPA
jgi:hypothetical protein